MTRDVCVLALDNVSAEGCTYLEAKGFAVERMGALGEEELRDMIPQYDALIVRSGTQVTKPVLEKAAQLRIVARAGVGVDNIDLDSASRRGIQVVNAPDGNTLAAAEHTMGLLLALARKLPAACKRLKDGCWDKKGLQGVELAGKTLGILGMGRVGTAVARRAAAFEMGVLAYDPYRAPEQPVPEGVTLTTMEDVLRNADFLTMHLPLTPETLYLVDADKLALLKPRAMLINVARGGVVDENALYEALRNDRLAGAAIDVFENEPVTDNPLFALDNVVVTPHLGASTREAQVRVAMDVAEDIAGFLQGEPPRNPVNRPQDPDQPGQESLRHATM